jgi:2',3'-cyclic-nucleotide 2'-phosphodiesterase/3'-nucleotidase
MANLWGKHLGVIALQLRHDGKRWTVDKDRPWSRRAAPSNADKRFVAADPAVLALIAKSTRPPSAT